MAGAVARAQQELAYLRKEISDLEERLAGAKEQAAKIIVFLEMAQIYEANAPDGEPKSLVATSSPRC
jgi:hypothetical protein